MRFNREKFADFVCNFYGQAMETDKRVYRLYLKAQLIASSSFWIVWIIISTLCRLGFQLCRHTPVISVGILSAAEYRLLAGFFGGQFSTAPVLVWIVIFALILGVILGGWMLTWDTRNPGIEVDRHS
jgi:hypothetical protein